MGPCTAGTIATIYPVRTFKTLLHVKRYEKGTDFALDRIRDLVSNSRGAACGREVTCAPSEEANEATRVMTRAAFAVRLKLASPRAGALPVMIWRRLIEGFLICLPVVILLVAGAAIALRSGVDEVETSRSYRQIAGNLSQMILRVVGYVAVLLAVQQLIGLRPSLGW